MRQGLRVMQPQVLNIQDRKLVWLKDRGHLAQGGWIGAGKDPLFDPLVHQAWLITAYGVNQSTAVVLQAFVNHTAQDRILAYANVL